MLTQETTVHCNNCESGKIKVITPEHTKYRCNECKLVVSSESRQCKYHPKSGSYSTIHPESSHKRTCRICGGEGVITQETTEKQTIRSNRDDKAQETLKAVDSLQQTINFDRKLQRAVIDFNKSRLNHPQKLIKTIFNHIDKYKPDKLVEALKQAIMPEEILGLTTKETDCDKWVEKTHIGNLIMWTLTLFLENKNEELMIQQIADASASFLGRKFSSHGKQVDDGTVGRRLEKPRLVQALEMMLQLCSAQLNHNALEDNGSFVNIYYDWFYLVQGGNDWEVCQNIGKGNESNAIKIGIGIEWDSKAVVSITMDGEKHRNDGKCFREDLIISQRPGLVHITDRGPFDTQTMGDIRQNNQHFIIQLKKNIKYDLVHPIFRGEYRFKLDTPSQTQIRLLESKLIRLHANPDLNEVKYVRFQYNSLRTGKFKTIELISSLPLTAEEIIQSHAWRWISTETEFNILQHQFGLEKLYIAKPEKVWPLLLLVLSGKMLMEFTYRSIHLIHGSDELIQPPKLQSASFRRGFKNFLIAVLDPDTEDPMSMIEPCSAPYCCFRNKRGQRLS